GPDVEFTANEAPVITPIANQPGTPNAFTFNGTSSRITVFNSASLQADGELTLEAWINPTGPGSDGIIVNKEGEYEVARFSDGTIRWAFANSNPGWTWINTGYVAKLNEWTQIAVVYDNGDVRTYADGELVHFFDGAGLIGDVHPGNNSLRIGDRELGIQRFQGQIDEVRVWTTTRSQTEIRDAMNRVLDGDEEGLAGYWTFDDQSTSGIAQDSTANNNDGFASGGAFRSVGPIRIDVRDQLGDPVYLHVMSDTPLVQVQMLDESNLLIRELKGFDGTAVITVTAFDGLGAAGDPHGRYDTVTFEYTTGGNSAQAIYGTKFNDIDGDGVRDPDEPGMDGVKLFLDLNANGLLDVDDPATPDIDESEPVTYTDVNGEYGFRGLEVVNPVAHGPAVLVGDAVVTPTGGAGTSESSVPTPSTIRTTTTATFDFTGELAVRAGLAFDGTDVVTAVPTATPIDLGANSTVELRLRYFADATRQPMQVTVLEQLEHDESGLVVAGYRLMLDEAKGSLQLVIFDGQRTPLTFLTPDNVVRPGVWHDVAVVVDRGVETGTVWIAVDGKQALVQEGVAFQEAVPLLEPLTLGGNGNPETGGFNGEIDQAAFWKIARTLQDAAKDFDELDPATGGLSAYWKLDEGQGDTAFDATELKNDGLLGKIPLDPAWFSTGGGAFAFSITLTPKDTDGNEALVDLRGDLNRLLIAQQAPISAEIINGKLAFVGAEDVAAFTAKATFRSESRESAVVGGTTFSTLPAVQNEAGALGFAGETMAQLVNGALVAAAQEVTDEFGEVVLTNQPSQATIQTTTSIKLTLTVVIDDESAVLVLDSANVGDNMSPDDLVDDLQLQLGVLAGKVAIGLENGRLRFATTDIGSLTADLLIFGETQTQSSSSLRFGDGTTFGLGVGLPQTAFSALGFGEDFAAGTDRSYLVAEIPFPGWTPTIGATSTANGVIGVQAVLFTTAGQIIEGVDFGNQLVAGVDLGEDRIVDEGDLVELVPTIIDPLGREGDPYDYLWQVIADNGQMIADGTEATFSFTPFDNGVYTIKLFVTDVERGLAAHPDELIVTSLNVAPVLEAGTGQTVFEGEIVMIEPIFSDAGTNDTHSAEIAWGDGTPTAFEPLTETGGAGTIPATHVYADDGVYTILVTVTDDDGAITTNSLVVTVNNVAPVVDAGADRTADEGSLVQLTVPDGESVSFLDAGTTDTHTATIDWGDDTVIEAGTVNESPFGPPGSTSGLTGFVLASHVYADDGVYTVTVAVTDDNGGVHADSFDITVLNVAPEIRPSEQGGREGELISLKDVAFFDPGTLDTHTGTVNWGDDSGDYNSTEALVIDPLTRTLHGSHVYADDGDYTVTFTLADDDGGVATQALTLTVAVVNDPPEVE
ncbi:MAG TPA: LamG-like jellyroll fold domain-containing protein, partial [Candidatus Limnocylindrales bacterium]